MAAAQGTRRTRGNRTGARFRSSAATRVQWRHDRACDPAARRVDARSDAVLAGASPARSRFHVSMCSTTRACSAASMRRASACARSMRASRRGSRASGRTQPRRHRRARSDASRARSSARQYRLSRPAACAAVRWRAIVARFPGGRWLLGVNRGTLVAGIERWDGSRPVGVVAGQLPFGLGIRSAR